MKDCTTPSWKASNRSTRSDRSRTGSAGCWKQQFPQLFEGLGKLEGDYKIKLEPGAKPYGLSTPRRVAVPLLKAVEQELHRMEELGVIARVTEPTDWCSGMVVVPTRDGKVRICVDLTRLNESVRRERHPLPATDPILAQLSGAQVFTKLDANSAFWQIPLATESMLLTTFITPLYSVFNDCHSG